MELDISIDKKYYKSDSVRNGRLAAKFFEELTNNIFGNSYEYWKTYKETTGIEENPLLYNERNVYSTIASAINTITPMHLSEWSISKKSNKELKKNRFIDFWCLVNGNTPINYFIELKKVEYNIGISTFEEFQMYVETNTRDLIKQIRDIKPLKLNWGNSEDVFIGLDLIVGHHIKGKDYYNESNIRENIYNLLDKRYGIQLILSTWYLPEGMGIQWGKHKCKFITIAGLVLSKKR